MRVWLQIQGSRVRSRPGPILSWRLIIKLVRSFSSLPLNHSRRVVVSYKRNYLHDLHEVLANCLFKLAQENMWLGDRPAMTIAVDLGRKATKQTNKSTKVHLLKENIAWSCCKSGSTLLYSIALFLRKNIHKHVLCISLRPSIIT